MFAAWLHRRLMLRFRIWSLGFRVNVLKVLGLGSRAFSLKALQRTRKPQVLT